MWDDILEIAIDVLDVIVSLFVEKRKRKKTESEETNETITNKKQNSKEETSDVH